MSTAKTTPSVRLVGSDLSSTKVPHKKLRFQGKTYYLAQYPEGDYCIHVDHGRGGGYGDSNVGFLLEDGTIEVVRGPFHCGGVFDMGVSEKLAEATGIASIANKATRLIVGEYLESYRVEPKRIVFEEVEWQLGDWRDRVRPEWTGLTIGIITRCGIRYVKP